MAQGVFKWCKNAIHRVIYCNRSQIFEQKRDCSWSIRECLDEQENGKRENWLDPMKQDRRFQTWRQLIPPRLTRSKTSPFNIYSCFFCDGSEFGEKSFYFCYPVFTYRDQLVRLTSGIFMGEFIEANNVHEDVCYRKTRKQLAKILIPEVKFHRQPKANESD